MYFVFCILCYFSKVIETSIWNTIRKCWKCNLYFVIEIKMYFIQHWILGLLYTYASAILIINCIRFHKIPLCLDQKLLWIMNWSRIVTPLVDFVVPVVVGATLFKKAQGSVTRRFKLDRDKIWQDCSSYRLTTSDFRFDITLSWWQPWCHFTQKIAAVWWVHTQRLHGACSSVHQLLASTFVYCSWSIVHSYFFSLVEAFDDDDINNTVEITERKKQYAASW